MEDGCVGVVGTLTDIFKPVCKHVVFVVFVSFGELGLITGWTEYGFINEFGGCNIFTSAVELACAITGFSVITLK